MNEAVFVEVAQELAKPEDVLPDVLPLLPLERKPFFPGQVLPILLDKKRWTQTLKSVQEAGGAYIGVVYVDGVSPEKVTSRDFRKIGTVCQIHQVEEQDSQYHVILACLERFQITSWVSRKRPFIAKVDYFKQPKKKDNTETKAYTTAIVNLIKELLPLNPMYGEELKLFVNYFSSGEPARLADFGACLTTASANELQDVLETIPLIPRMDKTYKLLQKEYEIAKTQTEIRQHIDNEINRQQREMFLREQLKYIQQELGLSKDGRTSEIEEFMERLSSCDVPEHARGKIEEEIEKFSVIEKGSPEYNVSRNYLDWLSSIPWGKYSKDSLNLKSAKEILDRDHEGLKEVKERILEFIGVGKMKGEIAGTILLLVGPPGVGKTSLGRSVANAIGRKFFRFSVGGMRDEAEIKGHRRTYIGAMPGKLIQALRETETSNPVIMLDEIDKIGSSYQGDPASALLEVLDGEQNKDFLDHYMDVRVDLSRVLFICTANQIDTIPAPLLDRMEVIRLSGYLKSEKVAIARNHLLPRQMKKMGIKARGQLRMDTRAIEKIVESYAREAGVRKLENLIGSIARKVVMKILKRNKLPVHVKASDVESYLGKPIFEDDLKLEGVGVVTGLAWTALGGATLDIEATRTHDFARGIKLTGKLGSVMQESAEVAYSYVLSHAEELGIDRAFFKESMIHIHVPAGATPKDGPSAGITIASALVSLARSKNVKKSLAMTGEMSLTGRVLPVGGIKEKVIAAHRMKVRNIILPEANRGDYEELPKHITKGLSINFAANYEDVFKLIF